MQDKPLDTYRADIDGLRAIAVSAVVLFHAFPGAIAGGFVGVDIFFVISGFLISSHIFKDLQAGRFSFASFYAKRVIRIFPALLKEYDKGAFAANLEKTVAALLAANKQVYLLTDIPQFGFDPQRCKYQRPLSGDVKCDMPYEQVQAQWGEYGAAMVSVQQNYPAVRLLDLNRPFCTAEICSMARDKLLFYRDNNHLNVVGSQYLGLDIADHFQTIKK